MISRISPKKNHNMKEKEIRLPVVLVWNIEGNGSSQFRLVRCWMKLPQVMKALDERRSGPLSMTSLAWETQLKLLKTSENLVVGLVTWEMCSWVFFCFWYLFWVWFCAPNFAGFAFGFFFGIQGRSWVTSMIMRWPYEPLTLWWKTDIGKVCVFRKVSYPTKWCTNSNHLTF